MVRVVEHSHHDDDVEITEGVASSAPLAFLRQGQPCLWSSHRRQRRALYVVKSQGARQGTLTSCEQRSAGGS